VSQAGAHGSHESAHGENGDRPRIARGFRGEITPPPAPAVHGEGPVVTDSRYEQYLAALAENPLLTEDNIRVPERAAGGVARALMVVGAVGIVLTLLAIFAANLAHALAAYMVGVFSVLACCLGAMFLVMVLHAVNAQWSTTMRRQLENVMALTWVPVLMMVPIVVIELVGGGVLLLWLRSDLQTNYLLDHKDPYLNGPFFALRFVLYAAVWIWLSRSLYGMSREQAARQAGIRQLHLSGDDDESHIRDLLRQLAEDGITRLLVEGGAATAAGFLRAGAVDRLYLYRAGKLIGGDGRASVGPLGVADVERDTPKFRLRDTQPLGGDVLDVYERAEQ